MNNKTNEKSMNSDQTMQMIMPVQSVPVKITRIIDETMSIKTFEFDRHFDFKAGQFCMVWIAGVDEIPMGLSSANSITVQKVGEATETLFNLKVGDTIGIKAPLGNGFSIPDIKFRVLAIAGGVGAAPLRPLVAAGKCTTFLLGSRSASEILYEKELSAKTDLRIATDDGTAGHHGFVTDLMKGAGSGVDGTNGANGIESIDLKSYDAICVCGPEIMMKGVLKILDEEGLSDRGQFSLVRYMKCGSGICGSCCMDPHGLRVCKDGPVFRGNTLVNSCEFGKYSRDATGRKH